MSSDNFLEIETYIYDALTPLFQEHMVFKHQIVDQLDNDLFMQFENTNDRIGAIIMNVGYSVDVQHQGNYSGRFKQFWMVAVVAPRELPSDVLGLKLTQVMQTLSGLKDEYGCAILYPVDDERGFNAPDYSGDLVHIPMMFVGEYILPQT